jgi:hypothetical protein
MLPLADSAYQARASNSFALQRQHLAQFGAGCDPDREDVGADIWSKSTLDGLVAVCSRTR